MRVGHVMALIGRWTVLALGSSFVLIPMLVTFMGGFKTTGDLRANPFGLPAEWHFEYFGTIIGDGNFWRYMGNSLLIAGLTVALTLIISAAAAYVFAQVRFFGLKMVQSYLFLGVVFPFATAILPLFIKVRDLGLLDSYWAVVLPQSAFGLSLSILLFKTFFEQLPKELFEAAYVEGCGYVQFFFRFTLPLSTPILATVGVFTFVSSWNNFLMPLVVINSRELYTWPLGMMQFRGEFLVEWNRTLAFITLTILPAIGFFFAAQKYIVAGLTGGAVK